MRRTLLAALLTAGLLGNPPGYAQDSKKKASKQEKKDKKENAAASTTEGDAAAPDKVLYDRAMRDIKKGRQEVARLTLQTLINTYPDSEYLAKAKLAIADSYYKEGGSANYTQAIASYKDFIVFFPFLPEAPYAQMQVAMTHYKEMAKPDRDRTEAKAAEDEFQTYLQKYPNDPLVPQAQQKLREVQEVLAEGDYRIAYYYYVKGDKRAAAGRLIPMTKRYPLYSKSDRALWMLGDIFEKSEKKEIAAVYYAKIVREYPLSELSGDAKDKLVGFKVPVPQPDPKALAWMQAELNAPRPKEGFMDKPMALLRTGPKKELNSASRLGAPNLQPETDSSAGTEILSGGGNPQIGAGGASSLPGNTAVVEIATPGSGASGGSSVETPTPAGEGNPALADPNGAAPAPADGTAPAADGANGQQGAAAQDGTASKDDSNNNKKESSSKKKKGIKKVIPW